MDVHHLDERERLQLAEANSLLWALTDNHDVFCECGLCNARMLTDVQEEESYHVPCKLLEKKRVAKRKQRGKMKA